MSLHESELRTAFLISGGGTTMEATIKAYIEGRLKGILPVAVIASTQQAGGIVKAKNLGIPEVLVVSKKDLPTTEAFAEKLLAIFNRLQVDLISQNGWLPLTPKQVVDQYPKMIVNQHPGPLDPGRAIDFGGKGMFGKRVTCSRLAYCLLTGQNFWTEASTHFVTPEYDRGDLIRVERLEFSDPNFRVTVAQLNTDEQIQDWLKSQTPQLQAQLLPLEHHNVIATLQLFVDHQEKGFRRSQPLIPAGNENLVVEARKIAKQLFPEG